MYIGIIVNTYMYITYMMSIKVHSYRGDFTWGEIAVGRLHSESLKAITGPGPGSCLMNSNEELKKKKTNLTINNMQTNVGLYINFI